MELCAWRDLYIRIMDNEWNVYRRYAEFRALHYQLRAQFPQVDTFNFPPKKAIGNKGLGPADVPGAAGRASLRSRVPSPQSRAHLSLLSDRHSQSFSASSSLQVAAGSDRKDAAPARVYVVLRARLRGAYAGQAVEDAKFVEERRKQLQGYLRMVMNKLIQTLPEFTAQPSKDTLLQLLPFCQDTPSANDGGTKTARPKSSARHSRLGRGSGREARNPEPQSGDL
ncbi:hypothetical protein P4O66_010821 [Electrophorus voltai]|uniref:PX domain-containing protein n=1 Tax=Electrophorus voltai TaxID=2609070 RepID=A0AAD8Z9U0_9TELE|nr:hypothetical protein P4O66_010821 [Electrophorus voltai]